MEIIQTALSPSLPPPSAMLQHLPTPVNIHHIYTLNPTAIITMWISPTLPPPPEQIQPPTMPITTYKTPNVYINSLPTQFPEDQLFALASPFWTVRSIRIFTRHIGERASGYGFVLLVFYFISRLSHSPVFVISIQ